MKIMLDSDICIYLLNGKHPQLLKKISEFPVDALAISSIVLAELENGVALSMHAEQNRARLNFFLAEIEVLSFNAAAAQAYGVIRSQLSRKGLLIGGNDLLIAAHALSVNHALVTNNHREFNRVPNLTVLDWLTEA
jgi:tRNA(fMet)-specific endonuclease VapC